MSDKWALPSSLKAKFILHSRKHSFLKWLQSSPTLDPCLTVNACIFITRTFWVEQKWKTFYQNCENPPEQRWKWCLLSEWCSNTDNISLSDPPHNTLEQTGNSKGEKRGVRRVQIDTETLVWRFRINPFSALMEKYVWKRDEVKIVSWIQAQNITRYPRFATPAHADSFAAIKEKWKRSLEARGAVKCWKWIWCRTFYRLDSFAAAGLGSGCCVSCLLEVR